MVAAWYNGAHRERSGVRSRFSRASQGEPNGMERSTRSRKELIFLDIYLGPLRNAVASPIRPFPPCSTSFSSVSIGQVARLCARNQTCAEIRLENFSIRKAVWFETKHSRNYKFHNIRLRYLVIGIGVGFRVTTLFKTWERLRNYKFHNIRHSFAIFGNWYWHWLFE